MTGDLSCADCGFRYNFHGTTGGFHLIQESCAMEKHYRLPKSEQCFPGSDSCFDKEGWIQTMEQTPLLFTLKEYYYKMEKITLN